MSRIEREPQAAQASMRDLLSRQGVTGADAQEMTAILARNPRLMADMVLHYSLGVSDPGGGSPVGRALVTFLSFLALGSIPILPFILSEPSTTTFGASVAATAAALVLLGLLRWRATGERFRQAMGETLAVGLICAVVAYLVGHLSAGKQTAAQASLALASRAPLTLLDEPQTGLDAPSRDLLTRAIIEEQALRPRTWVISTHLIDETAPLFERVLVLDAGRLVTDADVDELLTRWVRVEADPAVLEALPRLGELERLGGRGSAIVAASDVPAGFAGRTHPLTLQALAGVLPLASKE